MRLAVLLVLDVLLGAWLITYFADETYECDIVCLGVYGLVGVAFLGVTAATVLTLLRRRR
jgi:hypothetical protein